MAPGQILHIAGNYPDGILEQPTTFAVKNLVDATERDFDHFVVSIMRTRGPHERTVKGSGLISMSYMGLPALLGHSIALGRLVRRIEAEVLAMGVPFDIIHAHKLATEGLIAHQLSRKMGLPYAITLRAYTDEKVLRWRPDMRDLYSRVVAEAGVVFCPSPSAWTRVEKRLGASVGERGRPKIVILPNIVNFAPVRFIEATETPAERFLTVFRAGQGKSKGFRNVLFGVRRLNDAGYRLSVDVIGCDSESAEGRWVAESGLSGQIHFVGRMANTELVAQLPKYKALVLPTYDDTFGMVYVEALLSGVPVLYSAGAGIDGLIDGIDGGVRVDPTSGPSVEAGMRELLISGDRHRAGLARHLANGDLDFLRRESIAEAYVVAIRRALVT